MANPEPLDIIPSGKYILIADLNGVTYWLQRPTGAAILVFDGDNFYWGDGSDDRQVHFNPPETAADFSGVLGLTSDGRMLSIVNDTATAKFLVCISGVWSLQDANISGLPTTGFGVAVKVDEDTAPSYIGAAQSLITFDEDDKPILLGPGSNGDVLQIVGDQVLWGPPNSGAIVGTGASSVGLNGVVSERVSVSTVNVKIPTFTLSDGATEEVVANVNVTVDLTLPNGLLGLDVGGEANNKWYYIYIITDGVSVSAIISEDATAPDLTATGGYTHWALASVFRNDAAGNIIEFVQKGREFFTVPVVWGNNINSTTVLAVITSGTNLNTILPPNVKTCGGNVGGSTTETAVRQVVIASNANGIAKKMVGSRDNNTSIENFKFDAGCFTDMPIINPAAPELYWRTNTNSTKRRIEITSYSI